MSDELDREKDARIDEAVALAVAEGRTQLADLLPVFFAHGAAEDLVVYTAAELVAFAAHALDGLASRPLGKHRIRLLDPDFSAAGTAHKAVTVIEILNDDMPFLVDSTMLGLNEAGAELRLLVHPILSVRRDADGNLLGFADGADADARRESLIHLHVARLPDAAAKADLLGRLDQIFTDVRAAAADWPAMRHHVEAIIRAYRDDPPPLPGEAVREAIAFLEWLADNNFTFLGVRDYDIDMASGGEDRIVLKPESGLGLLKNPDVRVLRRGRELVQVTPEVREFMMRPEALIVTKANVKSRVHRNAHMDYVGIKRYSPGGRLIGELRVVGLFTASAYTRSTRAIPYLRQKVEAVMDRAGFNPESHSGKALLNVLESYPRDDLFQIDLDTLYDFAIAILELGERPRIRVLARRDKFDRFVSVLVFVPRDRYSTEVRVRIGDYLSSVYQGRISAFYPAFPEGTLARVHFIIGRDEGATPNPSRATLEAAVAAIVRTWADAFQERARTRLEPDRARVVLERFGRAFSPAYRDSYDPDEALADVAALERLAGDRTTTIAFRVPAGAEPGTVALKLFNRDAAVPLSLRVPMLEAMGFRVIEEQTFDIRLPDGTVVLHDMSLSRTDGTPVDLSVHGEPLTALFMAVWLGNAESDALNALSVSAGLAWREISLVRALSRYLQQAGIAYDQGYIAATLNRHPALAALIVALFQARFDPALGAGREVEIARVSAEIDAALDAVTSLDDDQIVRRLRNLVEAGLRTNFYQLGPDGRPRPVIGIKLLSKAVEGLPDPRPFVEIWVSSPRVEGVHLRFGKVARGGLRWSDRPQDFRTEVLGLVKAQQVKNAVIVPVGAKGGFFPKKLPAGGSREAVFAEGTEAYKLFVSTLLDLTDNIVADKVVPPADTVRWDDDDPYLVVAADKGTATFSDTANALADARGFWLSDAFASGGSVGYDHKKMGITARGAWEAVKRHFREMDVDIQTTPFAVAGVGDMSGDVFGNGMLLSPAIRLVAAFDHRDIFVDPNPDPAVSFAERQRLFALPRSSWNDYDQSLISAGGGVFSRQAKAIPLSPEMQALLGLDQPRATPAAVMNAILKAPVDLLWFGGIGTYVRGAGESDAEVGDRANDAIRIAATDLRAKVIGEGANLGMTQRARIAYGLSGGRCNSDAVDNSAGVNSSDVEVNIKIGLGRAVREKRLAIEDRNTLLAAMTPEVARLVLVNNYRQTLCVSLAARQGLAELGQQRRLMQVLEGLGRLDRKVEFLPDDATLARREANGQPLTRAEVGVLMAYAKIVLYDDLLGSAVPDEPALATELLHAFPTEMQERFPDDIRAHRLRREIIATVLANAMVNRGGPTYVTRIADRTGADAADIARAYRVAAEAFEIPALEAAIDALDSKIPGALQLDLYQRLQDTLSGASLWMVRNRVLKGDLGTLSDRFVDGIRRDRAARKESDAAAAARTRFTEAGVPAELAARVAGLPQDLAALDVVLVAEAAARPIEAAAEATATVSGLLGLTEVEAFGNAVTARDYYEGLALDRARRGLSEAHRRLAVLAADGGLDGWRTARAHDIDRFRAAVTDLSNAGEPTVARFSVAAGLLADLVGEA